MTDNKELIRSARAHIDGFNGKNDLRFGPNMLANMLIDVTNALEAAQAQMQEAVERATAAAYGACHDKLDEHDGIPCKVADSWGVPIAEDAARTKWQDGYEHGQMDAANSWQYAIQNLTPQSARDWLAAHDKEIVERERERCAQVVESLWAHRTCQEVADAIRAGGEQ